MKKIKAIIEKSNDGGISVYTEDVHGAFGYGLTEEAAKRDFVAVLEEQAAYYKERHGAFPEWYVHGYDVDYFYDLSGFFEAFPFINASRFCQGDRNERVGNVGSIKGKIVVPSEKTKRLLFRTGINLF